MDSRLITLDPPYSTLDKNLQFKEETKTAQNPTVTIKTQNYNNII